MLKSNVGMQRWWFFVLLVTASLLMGGCTPSLLDQDQDGSAEKPRNTKKSGAAASVDEAKKATIYIEAKGGLFDVGRGFGEVSYGSGSGFIISKDGLAVTNNHVVTGASYLQVYLEGEEDPVRADVLGVSECSDLALLDLEGDGYPYLDWRDGPVESGLDVTALGYPAQDVEVEEKPDQELHEGSVSSTDVEGQTSWASVDSVLEHEARIDAGNSGGPLVDNDGRVVGINYAGTEDQQSFAISQDEAQSLLDQLQTGDVESIGVNGEAFTEEEGGYSGIAVASVKTGSPADEVGIEGIEVNDQGDIQQIDIITTLEDTKLGETGTKEEFCEVLRGHSSDDPLKVEVYRGSFDENGEVAEVSLLEGTLNGEELKTVESTPTGSEAGYTTVTDDSGALSMEVPTDWSDVSGGAWEFRDQEVGAQITASTDVQEWRDTFNVPGVFFGASRALAEQYTEEQFLDLDDNQFSTSCEYDGRYDYDDGTYVGAFDRYVNCDGVADEFVVIAASPEGREFMTLVEIVTVDEASGAEARDHVVDTFQADASALP